MWLKAYCGNDYPTYLVLAKQFHKDGSFSGPYITLTYTGEIYSKMKTWGTFTWSWVNKVEKM